MRSRSAAGKDAPYRPGWDCHGLPIELKVDRDLGAKKREMSPLAFRQACRAYAEKFVGIQRDGVRAARASSGEWQDPYLTMSPSYQATIVRQLAAFAEKGLVYKAKKSVHWCISCRTALAEAEVEYDESHVSPQIDVRFPLAEADRDRLGAVAPGPRRQARLRRHLDDDALDAARQPRPRRPPRRRVRLLPARGHGRRPGHREGAARGLRGPLAREGQPGRRPAGARRAPRRGEGRGPRAPPLPPPLDRPRLPRRPRRLRHPRHGHRASSTPPPATAGTTTSPASATGSTSTARWTRRGASCPRSSASPGRRSSTPTRRSWSFLRERGALLHVRQGHALLPDLLALQEPDHLPRHRAVVHRPRRGPAHCASRPSRRSPQSKWLPGLGRGAHPQHDRDAPRLVHLAPAAVGRADPGLLLQGLRRDPAPRRPRAPRGRPLRDGDRGRLVRARGEGPPAPGLRLPEVRGRRASTRRRTSSTSGSTRAPPTRPSSGSGTTCPGRPTSTSRAATSTAAGSTRRCSSASPPGARRPTAR